MPTWKEVRERLIWLKNNAPLADDEKVYFGIPKREARERIRNEKKQRRIVIVTDEQGFTDFNVWKEAYMQTLGENPSLFMQALLEALKTFPVKAWHEEQLDAGHVMGKTLEQCE